MELNLIIMKKLFLLALVFSTSIVFGQKIIHKEINSIELGETRHIKIYIPPSYKKGDTRLYPLTVLFDGDYLFDVYVGNAKLFAQRDKAPEQIIVGILQGDKRYKDCSYDKVNGLPTEDSNKFYRFVRGELMDYLENNYPLSPFRTIVGNTLTANFSNFFAIEEIPAFDAFININPKYSPDMPTFLQNKFSTLKEDRFYYYLNSGTYNKPEKHDAIVKVANLLNNIGNPNLMIKFDNYKSTKTASIGQAIPAALAHIFSIYSAISKEEFNKNIAHLSPPDAIAYLENKYVEIEYLFGTNMKIRERDIFAIESIVLDKEDGLYLEDFGEMINKLYPETPLSDYYIGMFYEKARKYKQALKHYKNGYAKMDADGEDAEAYYQNIERILAIQDSIVENEQQEKIIREEQKQAEKEQRELEKIREQERKEAEKEEWKKKKERDKEMRKRYRSPN